MLQDAVTMKGVLMIADKKLYYFRIVKNIYIGFLKKGLNDGRR